jgi:hypothetical protein
MDTLHLEGVLETPSGTALSGHISVDLFEDGSWRSRFELHSSSILEPFDVDVRAYVTVANPPATPKPSPTYFPAFLFRYVGHVPALGNNSDPDESGLNPLVKLHWRQIRASHQFNIRKDYSVGGVLGSFADVYDEIVSLVGGAVGASLGVVIGVSKDAVGWIGATFGPGGTLGLVGGVVVFAVSASLGVGVADAALLGVVSAVVICVVTELLTDTRPLTAPERALAARVFGDTLPLDDIRLTNIGGSGGRGFTARGIDGKIYCNLGKAFYSPLGDHGGSYAYPGQLLIHELTHAWQINNGTFLPGLMCSMLVTQFEDTLIDDEYAYGPPDTPWDELNPEQQAAIVDDWYAGSRLSDGWASMDQQNVYYRYIWENVLQYSSPREAPTTLRSSSDSRLATSTRRSIEPGPPTVPGSPPWVAEHEDVFWAAGDGSLARQGGSGPGDPWSSLPAAALSASGLTSPDGSVAVLSRTPLTLDAFCIDRTGAVVWAGWSGQGGASPPEAFAPIVPATSARAGSPLVALARTPRHMDVFWVGPEGAITTAWWDADLSGTFSDNPPFAVTGPAAAQTGSGLAALSRLAQHIDLFWVGGDGAIETQWWDGGFAGGGWAEHSPFAISAPGAARLASPVVAISRVREQIDVFWIGGDGSIMTQWWRAGAGTGRADHARFPIAPAGSAGPGSGLSAVARTQQHLDVFWIAPDGSVGTQWWDGAPGANWPDHHPFGVTAAGVAHEGSPLSAVSRNPDRVDVCFVGTDGAIMAQWWIAGAGTGWGDHGPEKVSPPGAIARDFATVRNAAAHLQAESAALANVGKAIEAIDAIRRAVEALLRADVAPGEQEEYTRQLLYTELDLAFRLLSGPVAQFESASGDAVLVAQRAVAAGNDPVTIAGALRTLSSWASGAPAPQASVDAIAAAAAMLRPLAPAAGHEVDFFRTQALVTFDLSYRLIAAGHPELAAPAAEESIQAYRNLAAAGASVVDVTDALMTVSLDSSVPVIHHPELVGLATAAIDAARAAVDLLGPALATAPDDQQLRPRLAAAQLTLAKRFVGAGRPAEAADPAGAAVTSYEELAADDPSYNGLLAEAQALAASVG